MAFFLILAPFFTCAVLMTVASAPAALLSGAAVAIGLLLRDYSKGRSTKILNVGVVAVFGMLGLGMWLTETEWSRINTRLVIDGSLLAIVLATLAIKFPFTLQYAREHVEPDIAQTPGFIRTNYILTWVWAAAFVLMLTADMLMIFAPSLPLWVGIGIAYLVRTAAVQFTKWYPNHFHAEHLTR